MSSWRQEESPSGIPALLMIRRLRSPQVPFLADEVSAGEGKEQRNQDARDHDGDNDELGPRLLQASPLTQHHCRSSTMTFSVRSGSTVKRSRKTSGYTILISDLPGGSGPTMARTSAS